MIHQLKTEAEYFEAVANGDKPFEVRKNDRDFAIGDFLALNELTPHECNAKHEHLYTGRCCLVEITYLLDDPRFVKDGYAILGIRPCAIVRRYDDMTYSQDHKASFYEVPIYNPYYWLNGGDND